MANYIVCKSHLKPNKNGAFPDVSYTYIASDSHIGWHYTLTDQREYAYEFDELELKEAEFIAECWGMQVKRLI